MVIGNLSLIGLLIIFGLVLGRSTSVHNRIRSTDILADGLLYLPPIAFLLLNLSHWENMFWGMASLQNFTVILWVFWAIYLLAFTQLIWLALLLATAATLTSGNGLLIWPIGFAILLVQLLSDNRSHRKSLLIWTIVAIGVSTLYFFDYQKPPGNPPVRGSFIDLIKGWLAFNGAAAEGFPVGMAFTKCLFLGGIVTALILVGWLYIVEKRILNKRFSAFSYFFVATTAFVLGTAAIVAWSRVGFGMNGLITSRYKVYSFLLLALVYSYLVVQMRSVERKWVAYSGLFVSIMLMASSYRTYLDETISLRQWLLTRQFNWTYASNGSVSAIDPGTARLIDNSPAFYDSVLPELYTPAPGSPMPFASIQKNKDSTFVFNDTTSVSPSGPDTGIYLLLRGPKRLYLFPTTPTVSSSWKATLGIDDLFKQEIFGSLSEAEVDSATYQIERLIVISDGRIKRYPTGQIITANPQKNRDIQKNW